jgi:hypothetical protein
MRQCPVVRVVCDALETVLLPCGWIFDGTLCVWSLAEHGWVLRRKHCALGLAPKAAGGHCQLLVDALLLAFMLYGDTCIMMPIERSTQSGLLIPCH